MKNKHPEFKKWWEQAAIHRAKIVGPVEFEGKTYYGIRAAAQHCGYSLPFLRSSVTGTRGDNKLLVGKHGIRFVRIPRGPDDKAAPLYFDLDSLPMRVKEENHE